MAEHSAREHAVWSASATGRNWNCAGALALGNTVEHLDIESEAAAWGTACHQVAEKCLRRGVDAESLIGTVEKTKRHEFTVDEEMADTAQQYVDYVREQRGEQDWLGGKCAACGGYGEVHNGSPVGPRRCDSCGGTGDAHGYRNTLFIEERFSLAALNPPYDAGGTCDAIIYNPDTSLLEVVDLKGGRGVVVKAIDNKQLRTYALCAMLGHPELKVERIKSTIVQPRAPHKDGRIRSETYHVADLLDWTGELLARMQRAKNAETELAAVKGPLMREAWGDKWLAAGSHCTFCPAAGTCPVLEKKSLETANAFFHPDGTLERRNTPNEMDPAVLAKQLDGFDDLGNWMNARRALAQRLAEMGTEIPGYHLADTLGHRKFKEADEAQLVEKLAELGLTQGDIFIEKVRSPAQIEKVLGAKRLKPIQADFNALIHKPITGRTLVSSAKSTKPKVKGRAEAFFS